MRMRTFHRLSAVRPRRKPKLVSENVGSQSACSTCITACWMKRSSTVGMRRDNQDESGATIKMRRFAGLAT